jgi:hypothetical protein
MKKIKLAKTAQNLRSQGFDKILIERKERSIRVSCSQCEALVINGVACHETGCPNARKDHGNADDDFSD